MRHSRLTGFLALAAATACAHAPAKGPEVVWPDPPNVARIRFVRSIRSSQDVETSGWDKFRRALVGGEDAFVLQKPMGLAVSDDGQRLYVSDPALARVFRIDFHEMSFKPYGTDETWREPFGLALDADENLYVVDSRAGAVLVLDRQGRKTRSFGSGELERPVGVAVDRRNRIAYVVDGGRQSTQNHRVFAYDLEGHLLRQVGRGRGGGDGEFNFPTYAAVDSKGNLYVSDSMNFSIQVFGPDGQFLRRFGEKGDRPGNFSFVKALAFDGFGNLYAVDGQRATVEMFSPELEYLMFFGGLAHKLEFLELPGGLAIDPKANRIYVGEQGTFARINVYDLVNTTARDSSASPSAPAGK